MKILIIGNYYKDLGGISTVMRELKQGCPTLGHACEIHETGGFIPLRAFKYLSLLFKVKGFDILHGHCSSYSGFIPAFITAVLGFLFKKKVVITYHGSINNIRFIKEHLAVKLTAKLANKITTPIKDTAMIFMNYNTSVYHIPNILDIGMWPYYSRRTIKPKFINVRGIYDSENLINLFTKLVNSFPTAEGVIVGIPPAWIGKCTNKNIRCIKTIKRSKIPFLFKKFDIYINNISYDSFGYSMFEAMSCGLAVVSVPSKSLTTYAPGAVNFSKDSTPESIIAEVKNMLANQRPTKNKIKKGLSYVNKYSWDNLKDKWRLVYEF